MLEPLWVGIVEGEVPDEETYLLTENTKRMRAADLYE